jgi:hypothetical protein
MSEVTQRDRAIERKAEVLTLWREGNTITAIGKRIGVHRSVVGWLLEQEGVRDEQADQKAAARGARRQALLAWIRHNPGCTLQEAASATGLAYRTVGNYLAGEPERELVLEKRVHSHNFSRETMLHHLRLAWKNVPSDRRRAGLSKNLYIQYAAPDAPSQALYQKRFPSWRNACAEAGVPAFAPYRSTYAKTYSEADLLDAVQRFMDQTGETSFANYVRWSQEQSAPSGALLINRFGRWSVIRKKLIDRKSAAA